MKIDTKNKIGKTNWFGLPKVMLSLALIGGIFPGSFVNTSLAQSSNRQSASQNLSNKISDDLRSQMNSYHAPETKASVILQLNAPASGQLNALFQRNGVRIKGQFENFNSFAVELPVNVIEELALYSEVEFVSQDAQVQSLGGHLSQTTGTDAVRNMLAPTSTVSGLDGTGIGIAIIDSGIYTSHRELIDSSGKLRTVYNQDFTGEGTTKDIYGHGTHVASIAAGNSYVSSGAYIGIAPNAKLINLRVLNSQGTGTTSALLNALNWIYSNRTNTTYNIKVVNMSLGAPAINSYKNDPLCQAVRKLVDAGIVVVAAAGNDGKSATGQKQYGTIHSPGNEPSAITVGASNTYGTNSRADDGMARFLPARRRVLLRRFCASSCRVKRSEAARFFRFYL